MRCLRSYVGVMLVATSLVFAGGCTKSEPKPTGPTFRGDVAKIVYDNCSYCHRPGQAAPFDLLTFKDVSERAKQIAEVVESRFMPPWLPGAGYNHFRDQRTLTQVEIDTIRSWADAGAPEGVSEKMPKLPEFSNEWYLGEPDMVVKMEEPFSIPADGPDVYRAFAIPIPTEGVRYVRAMEFRPGNPRVVHHAFLAIDSTTGSKRADDMEEGPGFEGMHLPSSAVVPDGQFFSWQPGKVPMGGPAERAWTLLPGSWLVLQLHLQTTGKEEKVQSELGFYFSETPATDITFKLGLSSYNLDIAAGATNFLAEDAFELPVDVELLGILPHSHYLAREMQGVATLPDGSNQWLLNIPAWDFNWQGEYWYDEPIKLPAGSRVGMRFFFDNSTNNLANPSDPPLPVTYGLQSTDEMAELWMMFRVSSEEDRATLNRAVLPKTARDVIAYSQLLLKDAPEDAVTRLRMATAYLSLKQTDVAVRELQRAIQFDPELDEAFYYLGFIAFNAGDMDRALLEFGRAVRINPDNFKAHGYMGLVYMRRSELTNAEHSFLEALRANPNDGVARGNLERLRAISNKNTESPAVQ